MRRKVIVGVLTAAGMSLMAAAACADVIIRGPFGQIVVPTPVDVRVGPGVFVGAPPKPGLLPPGQIVIQAPFTTVIVPKPLPLIRPKWGVPPPPPNAAAAKQAAADAVEVAPPPTVAQPVLPQDFAKNFKVAGTPASYEVVFLHPLSQQPVAVTFGLPAGTPRLTYDANALVFDYGQGKQVEIRFQDGGKVRVMSIQ